MDLYRPLLEKLLFPAFETARGRPTVPLLQFLRGSERWSPDALLDLQAGLLRRLVRHAAAHTPYYRSLFADRGLVPEDFATVEDLRHLPVVSPVVSRSEAGAGDLEDRAEPRHWRDA